LREILVPINQPKKDIIPSIIMIQAK